MLFENAAEESRLSLKSILAFDAIDKNSGWVVFDAMEGLNGRWFRP